MTMPEIPEEYDLSHLSPEDREQAQNLIWEAASKGRVFTDRDVTPGDTGHPTSN